MKDQIKRFAVVETVIGPKGRPYSTDINIHHFLFNSKEEAESKLKELNDSGKYSHNSLSVQYVSKVRPSLPYQGIIGKIGSF